MQLFCPHYFVFQRVPVFVTELVELCMFTVGVIMHTYLQSTMHHRDIAESDMGISKVMGYCVWMIEAHKEITEDEGWYRL